MSAMSTTSRNIQLAQASLEHAIYFLELGATQRATSYLEFAAQKLQEVNFCKCEAKRFV